MEVTVDFKPTAAVIYPLRKDILVWMPLQMENSDGRGPLSPHNSDQVITSQIGIPGEKDLQVREEWGKTGILNEESHFPCIAKC